MVTWSKNYNDYVIDTYGEEYLDTMRHTQVYTFPTKNGLRGARYFCERYQVKSAMDYGCGKFNHLSVPMGTKVTYYDPFVPGRDKRPEEPADIVFLNNVLNDIEPDYVEEVLEDVKKLCNKVIVCGIRVPGFYNATVDFYLQKCARRGLIVKEQNMMSVKNFLEAANFDQYEKYLVKKDRKENETPPQLLYLLLEKDPNF